MTEQNEQEQLERKLEGIDPRILDSECAVYAQHLGDAARAHADSLDHFASTKRHRELVYALQMIHHRALLTVGGKEPTVSKLENIVETDEQYHDARLAEAGAAVELSMATAHLEAMRAKGRMLESLVALRVSK